MPGREAVDQHAVGGERDGERAGDRIDPGLARGVGGVVGQRHARAGRGDVDDAPRALVAHHPAGGLAAHRERGDVEGQRAGPGLVGRVEEGLDHPVAGVVDQRVDAAPAAGDARDGCLGRVREGEVARDLLDLGALPRAIAAVSARPSALMSAMPTRQPRAASCNATSRPSPPAAPVTSTRGAGAGVAGLDKSASRTRFSLLIFVTGTIGWLSTGRRAVPDGEEG